MKHPYLIIFNVSLGATHFCVPTILFSGAVLLSFLYPSSSEVGLFSDSPSEHRVTDAVVRVPIDFPQSYVYVHVPD